MDKEIRNSNYELLRIVSMFLIVLGHVLLFGKILNYTSGFVGILVYFLEALLIIHVNSFILVTGYYQSTSKFRLKKLLSLNNAAWFYRIVILLVVMALNLFSLNNVDVLKNLFPIDLGFYWFLDLYLILYCLSPFLNLLIEKMSQLDYKKLLLILFLIFSVLPTITNNQAFDNINGYSLNNFIFLYFIGAYIRKYPFNIFDYFKTNSFVLKKYLYLVCYFLLVIINLIIFRLGFTLLSHGNVVNEIGLTITNAVYSYANPLVILGSISYFLWFGGLNIKSKIINYVSPLVFGVYLVHENVFSRQLIYNWLGLDGTVPLNSYSIFIKIILATSTIFIICLAIEWLRQMLFKFISTLKISIIIKDKWHHWLSKFKFNY